MRRIPPSQIDRFRKIGGSIEVVLSLLYEKVHPYTVDTHRIRDLNCRLAVAELGVVSRVAQQQDISPYHLLNVIAETINFVKDDEIVRQLVPSISSVVGLLEDSKKSLGGNPKDSELSRDKHLLHSLSIDLSDQLAGYRQVLIDRIVAAVRAGSKDVKWFSNHLGPFLTELTDMGYSRSEISDQVDSLGKELLSVAEPFEHLCKWFETLRFPDFKDYAVIFRLNFSNQRECQQFPQSLPNAQVLTGPVWPDHWGKGGQTKRYLKVKVSSVDPTSAKEMALDTAIYWLSIVQLSMPSMRVSVDRDCRVQQYDVTGGQYVSASTSIEILGPAAGGKLQDYSVIHQDSLLTSLKVTGHSRERIIVSLRSHRAAMSCRTYSESLLHLWVALETLVVGGTNEKINKLIDVVAAINALSYPYRLSMDLYANLYRHELVEPFPHLPEERVVAFSDFFGKLLDPDRLAALEGQAYTVSVVLADRVAWTAKTLASLKSIKTAVERNRENVRRHMWRIYRARNALVHGGSHVGHTGNLCSHLFSYYFRAQHLIREDLANL